MDRQRPIQKQTEPGKVQQRQWQRVARIYARPKTHAPKQGISSVILAAFQCHGEDEGFWLARSQLEREKREQQHQQLANLLRLRYLHVQGKTSHTVIQSRNHTFIQSYIFRLNAFADAKLRVFFYELNLGCSFFNAVSLHCHEDSTESQKCRQYSTISAFIRNKHYKRWNMWYTSNTRNFFMILNK